jgi:hypothetical protein
MQGCLPDRAQHFCLQHSHPVCYAVQASVLLREAEAAGAFTGSKLEKTSFLAPLLQGGHNCACLRSLAHASQPRNVSHHCYLCRRHL